MGNKIWESQSGTLESEIKLIGNMKTGDIGITFCIIFVFVE